MEKLIRNFFPYFFEKNLKKSRIVSKKSKNGDPLVSLTLANSKKFWFSARLEPRLLRPRHQDWKSELTTKLKQYSGTDFAKNEGLCCSSGVSKTTCKNQ